MTKNKLLAEWLKSAQNQLAPFSQQSFLEVQLLASTVLEKNRAYILAHPDLDLSDIQIKALDKLLERLLIQEPLPYILGKWDFFGLTFFVNPNVLIPRPETELLVETALNWLKKHPGSRRAVDVGTGSGCIAISLAHSIKDLKISALDISSKALEVARSNIQAHQLLDQVFPVCGNLLASLNGPFDLVVANLPYIPSYKIPELQVSKFEPHLALDGGMNGLTLIERLVGQLQNRLSPCSMVILEIEAGHGESAPALVSKYFNKGKISLIKDLAGHPRFVMFEKSAE
jgi:release factor glutamine methyltransferase